MEIDSLRELEINGKETRKIEPNLGINEDAREKIADGLKQVLADSYLLMLKTQNYHWNIRGKMFISVHNLTEEMYNELFPAIDVIAERIRSLGFLCPGSMEEFSDLGTVSENHKENSELEMVRDLVTANETVARKCRSLIGLASDHLDEATADLLTSRLALHEKNAWMFRSFLEQ